MTGALHSLEQSLPNPCLHCGQPCSGEDRYCCRGCEAAAQMVTEPEKQRAVLNAPVLSGKDLSVFVSSRDADQHSLVLLIEGMRCAACAFLIEGTLNKQPGVAARVNLTTRRLTLEWSGNKDRASGLIDCVTELGYTLRPFDTKALQDDDAREEKFLLHCLAVAGFASGNIMLLSVGLWASNQQDMGLVTRDLMHWLSALIAIPTMIFAGRPFFRSAWQALKFGRTNMDVPISVALILTTGMSLFETVHHGEHAYFDSVVMLLFLLLVGRYLDRRTRGKARSAAEDLLMMVAGTATVEEVGALRLVPIRDLATGMLVRVAVGERVPADAEIVSGQSEMDASFISGETVTQPVAVGDAVYGGMVNVMAPITVRITATHEKSLLADVIKLMEKAEQGHAQYVRLADRVARYYTPVVHALALGTFLVWTVGLNLAWQPALMIAMTVLIITCPCALGLAVPAVQVLASSRLFKHGLLLKSADALERLATIDTVVFDKTGTLTEGDLQLANPAQIGGVNMQRAASLAAHSKHPIARSLYENYGGKLLDVAEIEELPGRGISGLIQGKQVRLGRRDWCAVHAEIPAQDDRPETWLAIDGAEPVRFVFEDSLRSDAAATVAQLQNAGLRVILLSGDRESAVQSAAAKLGIADWHARVTPVDKNNLVEKLRNEGRRVLMVGDGLNDAAALMAADVSISPSTAMDITQNAADIVFQGHKLMAVVEAWRTARRSVRLVKENFFLSFFYNALAVPLAMMGFVTPLIAALAMSGSSLVVVLNAQRVKRG